MNAVEIPAISVIIPTYGKKGVELTKKCLDSLQETHGHLFIERLVVSDGEEGAEELVPIVAGHQGQLFVVPRGGFAKACNYGLLRANGNLTFLLNNDIEFFENTLQTLWAVSESYNAGVIGCRLLYPDHTIQHAGVVFVPTPGQRLPGYWDHAHRGEPALHPGAVVIGYQLVTGALLGINHWARMTIGMLDERLPFSCEDIAYGIRALEAGSPPLYCGVTAAIHHEGATRGRTPEEKAAMSPETALKEQISMRRFFEMFPATDWRMFAPQA